MSTAYFHDVALDEGFLTGRRADGTPLNFTRQERALLSLMAPQPGRLFTRDELWNALGSRGSDRSVDFVVNRLRGKLGDDGPQRRFISTQYGEGYVWVAPRSAGEPREAFIALLQTTGQGGPQDEAVIEALKTALQAEVGSRNRILQVKDKVAASPHVFALEVSLHWMGGVAHAGLALKRNRSGGTATTFRERLADPPSQGSLKSLARAVLQAAWRDLALGGRGGAAPTDPPLHLRLHAASILLDPPGAVWVQNGEQIRTLRAENPDDSVLAILWAMHLFGRLTIDPGPEPLSLESNKAWAAEIEGLVFASQGAAAEDPILALAAAKLLLGVNRGHEDLAERLAMTAFASSAAFAASFPMLGQIKACRGELGEALRHYDEGLRLCEPGSAFELYIQILRATALIAAEDHEAVETVYDRLVAISPAEVEKFALLFLPADDAGMARRLAPYLDRISEAAAKRMIAYLHIRVARQFRNPEHSANLLRGPLTHLVRRFGPGVVSPALWRDMPAEFGYLRGAKSMPGEVAR
ncbi:MAG: winged helix-turn-helix domain-containing protein [Phenylobacterium sp.]|uniref:winged helix-turn-helix domain-containing protein n=1 Tax=Phenylobacterium sp. TaxID=1871053 RepID=UPI00391D36E5